MTRGKARERETRERVIELVKAAHPYAAISRSLGVPDSTVRTWALEWFRTDEARAYIQSNNVPTAIAAQRVEQAAVLQAAHLISKPDLTAQDACSIGRFANIARTSSERDLERIERARREDTSPSGTISIPVPYDRGEVLQLLPTELIARIAAGEPWHEVVAEWEDQNGGTHATAE